MKKIVSFCLALCATTALWAGTSNFKPAAFSVAEGTQIAFAQGNLQYTKSTDAWVLAENQYDMIGSANVSGDALADKIDLFGWSGSTGSAQWGVSISEDNADYAGDFVDWGKKIGAGTTYRTPTKSEWSYLLHDRANANEKKGIAHIELEGEEYVNGLILLPDNWTAPADVTFKPGYSSGYVAHQTFTLAQWQKLEAAGAVFLPATGYRKGGELNSVTGGSCYWSATLFDDVYAYYMYFNTMDADMTANSRNSGFAVRLVRDVHVNIAAVTNGTVEVDNLGATEGETVTLTITPASHYVLKSISVMQGETEIALTAVDGASNQYTFTMPAGDVAVNVEFEEIAPAAFSIADGKYIYFSQGNLQCTLSTTDTTWSFAEHQYDMIGWGNTLGPSFAEKIDLFGWSGSTGSAKWGVSTSTNPLDYAGDFVDWGKNIGDGNTYRTLTKDEWDYLLKNRTGASEKQGVAHINITEDGAQAANGLILLPDNWVCPDGITFASENTDYSANTFTLAQWQKLEAAGAVFLPAAGARMMVGLDGVQSAGNYWTATPAVSNYAFYLGFGSDKANANTANVCLMGFAVRLVQDLHVVSIAAAENGTVAIDKLAAAEGETVTITVTPAEGYEVESITVTYGAGEKVEVSAENTFVMPAGAVTITVVFKESGTAIETIEIIDLRTENGRVIYDGEFQIFDFLGRNVTRLNGSLNGVYIVKVGDKAQKVVVK